MKPLFPYIGSKQSLLKEIKKHLPAKIQNYYEPFVGGGTMLFYLNEEYNIEKNFINDIDVNLINVYNQIKNKKDNVKKMLKKLETLNSKEQFGKIIEKFNTSKKGIKKAAYFIYIAKRSFNSRFNYNKNGFVKPNYSIELADKSLIDEENFEKAHTILQKTEISNKNFFYFKELETAKEGDFIFLDPPYLMKNSKYFYKSSVTIEFYEKLAETLKRLNQKSVKFILTTNYSEEIENLFKNWVFVEKIKKHSKISNGKGKEHELLIFNYNDR
jgi:DNA adenine methylase